MCLDIITLNKGDHFLGGPSLKERIVKFLYLDYSALDLNKTLQASSQWQ